MKKTLLLAVVAVAVISASCRKERTCTCTSTETTTFTGGSNVDVDNWTVTSDKQKKSIFKYTSNCFSHTSTQTFTTGTTVVDDTKCELN